jgi:hypothetical protein
MTAAEESLFAKTPIGTDLAIGVDTLSLDQELEFTQYTRVILPVDGSWFWIRSDLVSDSALYNAAMFNSVALNQGPNVLTAAPFSKAKGSLHYETIRQQNEDETLGINRVIFTSEQEITDLNAVGPNTMFISTVGAERVRFAFSRRDSFYYQAGLFHYVGTALYPALASQIIDDVSQFNAVQPIVSNSLPLWLALNGYQPLPGSLACPLPLYPSFAVPANLEPPYGVVHVFPEATTALQPTPYLGPTLSHDQLAQDRVRVTLYGLHNFNALSFLDAVNDYSLNTDNFGIMDPQPAVRDEKRTQAEFNILAQKKTMEWYISYYQSTARTVARQLIESAIPTYVLEPA